MDSISGNLGYCYWLPEEIRMTLATTVTHYTPEDLLTLPEYGRFELIDGQLVERKMGAKSSLRPRICSDSFGILFGATTWGSSFKLIVVTRSLPRSQVGSGLLTDHSYVVENCLRAGAPGTLSCYA